MLINVEKLDGELRAASIPIEGCDSNGQISFSNNATDEQRERAKLVLAAHDPAQTREQSITSCAAVCDGRVIAAMVLVARFGTKAPQDAKDILDEAANITLAAWGGA